MKKRIPLFAVIAFICILCTSEKPFHVANLSPKQQADEMYRIMKKNQENEFKYREYEIIYNTK